MRPLLHLLSMLLVLPQALLVAALQLLDHVTATHTFFGFLNNVLDTISFLLGWGGLSVIVLALFIAAAGFSDRWRVIASGIVLVFDVCTAAYLVISIEPWAFGDMAFFLSPGVVAALLCAWVIRKETKAAALATQWT